MAGSPASLTYLVFKWRQANPGREPTSAEFSQLQALWQELVRQKGSPTTADVDAALSFVGGRPPATQPPSRPTPTTQRPIAQRRGPIDPAVVSADPRYQSDPVYRHLYDTYGRGPTAHEYAQARRWIEAQTGQTLPTYGPAPTTAGPSAAGNPSPFIDSSGQVINPQLTDWLSELAMVLKPLRIQEQGALERLQAQLASAESIAAQQNAAALERLRYQVGVDLADLLSRNQLDMAKRKLDIAQLAADPRSSVGYLEFLAQSGGGPTAISQNLTAGIEPSPVWEYFPEVEGLTPETRDLVNTLTGFIQGIGR